MYGPICRGAVALVALLGGLAAAPASAGPPTIQDLLRKAEFEDVQISPTGDYFALRVPLEEMTVLAIMRRSDGTITTTMSAGRDGFIDSVAWIGEERVLASWSKRIGRRSEPYAMSSLQVVDVDGRNRRAFEGWIVDPMTHDPDRVLVVECARRSRDGCVTRLREVGVLGKGRARNVVDGPVANARFMVDRGGNPVFSWAWNEDGEHQLFLRHEDTWLEINNSATSATEVHPMGLDYEAGQGYEARHGYLWSQRTTGPDVIERIDLTSGERTVAASDPAMDPSSMVWSFDQREIIGVRYGRGAGRIRYLDEQHPHVVLHRQLEDEFPGRHVRVTSATRNGRLVVVRVDGDREPGDFHLLDIVSGELVKLMDHRQWIDRGALAAVEPVTFPGRDGQLLDGYLTRPLSVPAAGAPLVVLVHGGPIGFRDGWGFDPEVQMLAAHGYAVMQVNFRGSSGRGRDFIESGHRQWGSGMIDDIVDGSRWAQAQAGVSPSMACIWGASYGGYAALRTTAREPGLFRCAVGMAGPYDLPTLFKRGDVRESKSSREYMRRILGDDDAILSAESPSSQADAIDAALFIVQGGRDRRVDPQHARIMRRALDKAGKEYESYLAANETHGFYDDESEREYYSRVFRFLGRHLGAQEATAPYPEGL